MPNTINQILNTFPEVGPISHKERVDHTPISDGEWKTLLGTEGERGISRFYPKDPGRSEILKKYGTYHIKYNINAEPDFSNFAIAQVKISNMSANRQGNNFPNADAKLVGTKWATDRGLFDKQSIENYRKDNNLTWHEKCDGVTMELVPEEIHSNFPHLGGVSIMSHVINEDGVTVGSVIIKAHQSVIEFQETINNATIIAKDFISAQTGRFMSENFKQINAAGVDEAVNSAMFAAVLSTTKNTISVIKGEESATEAIKEILYDTSSAAVLGYTTGVVKDVFNIGELGDAALLVNGTIQISKQVFSYVNGEIDERQLLNNVAESTAYLAAAYVGRIIGSQLIPIPIVGSYIGEMITTAICSEVISTIKTTKEFEKKNKKYISLYHRAEREIKASNERLKSIIEAENEELKIIIREGFESIYNGINDNSYDLMIKGLGAIGSKFGISEEELKKDRVTRENIFKNRDKVITIGKGV